MPATGALLGVGAHLLNALPDLADDEATGRAACLSGSERGSSSGWHPRSRTPDGPGASTTAGLALTRRS
jgi:hypothetical protein